MSRGKEVVRLEDFKQAMASAIVGAVAGEVARRLLDSLLERIARRKEKTPGAGKHYRRS